MFIPQDMIPVQTLKPAADAAGRNGEAVSLKNAEAAFLVVHIDQGNAATIAIAPEQCTNVAGAGGKAIPACPIYVNQDAGTASPLTKQAAAANFTTSAAVKQKIVIFQLDIDAFDIAGGFDCVRAVTGASNAANITEACVYIRPRFKPLDVDAKAN